MKIKVLFPFTQFPIPYLYTTTMKLRKGELVVVRFNGKEKVGVVSFINYEKEGGHIEGKVIRKADSFDRYDFWQEFERLLLKQRVKITDEAFEVYKTTYGNQNISRDMAERKLTRNLLLSYKSNWLYISNRMITLKYGSLHLQYRDGMIHQIERKCKVPKGWKKDIYAYDYFGQVLGIEEGELVG